ncbi:unnamed protein product [Ectocarpus sp. 8 AP-2014]
MERRVMFYAVCVPTRILYAVATHCVGSSPLPRTATIVLGLASYFFNSNRLRLGKPQNNITEPTWWYRSIHMLSGLSVSLFLIASPNTQIPSSILLVDTLFAITTSVVQKPFR